MLWCCCVESAESLNYSEASQSLVASLASGEWHLERLRIDATSASRHISNAARGAIAKMKV